MLSIVVPAYNEKAQLSATIQTIAATIYKCEIVDYEIIIVDDGSTDGSFDVIQKLQEHNPNISCIQHARNRGPGSAFLTGLAVARYPRITILPADNATAPTTLLALFGHYNAAEVVLAIPMNTESRSPLRHLLSQLYSMIYSTTFNTHLKCAHGWPVYPTERLRNLPLRSTRYSMFTEINVRLIRRGYSFVEINGYFNTKAVAKSSAVRVANLWECMKVYLGLIYDVFWRQRSAYGEKPNRALPPELAAHVGGEHIWCSGQAPEPRAV